MLDFAGIIVAFTLTVCVLSYLIGDNPLYRIAVSLFVGAVAGYAVVVVVDTVIYPQILAPISVKNLIDQQFGVIGSAVIGLVLAVLLLLKLSRGGLLNRLGSLSIAFMVGVGAAVAVGGSITGTLFPQVRATFLSVLPANQFGVFSLESAVGNVIIIIGTLATLGSFYYGGRAQPGKAPERTLLGKPVAAVGQVFIGTAFGALYAGAVAASLAFFIQNLSTLWQFAGPFIKPFIGMK